MNARPTSLLKFACLTPVFPIIGFLLGFSLGNFVTCLWLDALEDLALPPTPNDLSFARIRFGVGLALLASSAPLAALIAAPGNFGPRAIAAFSALAAGLGIIGVWLVRNASSEMVQAARMTTLYMMMTARSMPLIQLPVACAIVELLSAVGLRIALKSRRLRRDI